MVKLYVKSTNYGANVWFEGAQTDDRGVYFEVPSGTQLKVDITKKINNKLIVASLRVSDGKYIYFYSDKDYFLNTFKCDPGLIITVGVPFTIDVDTTIYVSPDPMPLDPKIYEIVFFDTDTDLIGSMFTTNSTFVFSGKITVYARGEPRELNLEDCDWQGYQTSGIIRKNSRESVTLKDVVNIFYLVAEPKHSDSDPMRIVMVSGDLGSLDFGEIQSNTDQYTASLKTVPVVPFGYRRSFCMDLGVERSISVSYRRTMPIHFNDDSKDSRDWSNAKWQEQFKKFSNRWQMRSNGVRLYLLMPGKDSITGDMSDCYPQINPNPEMDADGKPYNENWVNAYLTNEPVILSAESTHSITGTVSFAIGTIYPKSTPLHTSKVTLVSNGRPPFRPEKTMTMTFPSDAYSALPYFPQELYRAYPEFFFTKWKYEDWDQGRVIVENTPGTIFLVPDNDDLKLYAMGFEPSLKTTYYDVPGEYTHPITAGSIYFIFGVAGGGGGGSDYRHLQFTEFFYAGGAGGGAGGSFEYYFENVGSSGVLNITVGKGGAGASAGDGKTGESGGETKVSSPDGFILRASGGGGGIGRAEEGGKGGDGGSAGAGGFNGGSGGDGGSNHSHVSGLDGKPSPGGWDNYGRGGSGYGTGSTCGGGGGGGPALPRGIEADFEHRQAHGGNGGSNPESGEDYGPKEGYFGGGGGGGINGHGGADGGNGYVMIVELEADI